MKRKIRELTEDVKHPELTLPWWIPYESLIKLRKQHHSKESHVARHPD